MVGSVIVLGAQRPDVPLGGKVTAVFGGANGIGEAVSRLFARMGALVAIVDVDLDKELRLAEELTSQGCMARAWYADTSDDVKIAKVVDEVTDTLGAIDAAVLSVYYDFRSSIVDLARVEWDRILGATLTSGYSVARACLPQMVSRHKGSLVFISSIQSRFGLPREPGYASAKAGLCGLARQLAVEYGPAGVRVNTILPSAVIVDRNRQRWEHDRAGSEGIVQLFPLRRLGQPDDVAQAALFLASDASDYITGVELAVDGGLSICPVTRPVWDNM